MLTFGAEIGFFASLKKTPYISHITLKYAEIGLSWKNLGKATLSHMKEAWNASKLQFHACNAGSSLYPGRGKISTGRWAFQNAMLAD